MNEEILLSLIEKTLSEKKAENIKTLDVKKLTDVTDFFVIGTSTSTRHAKALSRYILEAAQKKFDLKPYGIEGDEEGEWILIDFLSIVVHIMLPETREFYNLESLWRATKSLRVEEK